MESRLDELYQPTEVADPGQHLTDAININGADLRSELEHSPADIAHYSFKMARAHRRWLKAKINVKEVEAATLLQVREDLEGLGEKVTEGKVEARMRVAPAVREANAEFIEAEFEREQLRAVCTALIAKRDNLQSLVMLAKAEMSGNGGSWRDPSNDTAEDA